MKKLFPNKIIGLMSVVVLAAFGSCQKEGINSVRGLESFLKDQIKGNRVVRPYKDDFKTYYRFVPDISHGWVAPNPGPAWYPGGGEGNATHIGKAYTYFNQYATVSAAGFSSAFAPVNMFFESELRAVGITVPHTVGSIVFDHQGNSIWFQQAVNTATSTVVKSATRINFTGTSNIINGTGKFTNATGLVTLRGYFNPINANDAGVGAEGWIMY